MVEANYVPAIGEQFANAWQKNLEYNNFDVKFFSDKSFFKHPLALQCAFYGINGATDNKPYREAIGYPTTQPLLFDSGGFQMFSLRSKGQKMDMTPLDSLRWQEANAIKGDVMFNLDVPPALEHLPTMEDMHRSLNESVANFKLFEKERKNYDALLLNVLHGHNKATMDVWYNGVKDFNFDGYAIGNPSLDPMIHAQGLMYLFDKGEYDKPNCKWIHLFGKGGQGTIPLIVYFASKIKRSDIKVTFDSSSYNVGSIYRKYYMPFDVTQHLFFGDKFNRCNPSIKQLPCKCPVCSNITDLSILNGETLHAGTLISLHNLYQYIYLTHTFNSLVSTRKPFKNIQQQNNDNAGIYSDKRGIDENEEMDVFTQYTKDVANPRTLIAMNFIDFCIEYGFDNAVKKFARDFVTQEENICKQVSIFNF